MTAGVAARRLAIVGAGLTGLTAARHLLTTRGWAAADLVIIEGHGEVGGRLATEVINGATFDHGAQFFTVRSTEFDTAVQGWVANGLIAVWCRGFTTVDGYPRYRVEGGMTALARHLAAELGDAGVEIMLDSPVAAIVAGEQDWTATPQRPDRSPVSGRAMLLTPPVPQATALLRRGEVVLDAKTAATLDGFACHQVLALLAVLDSPPPLAEPGALQQPDDPTFSFIADNQAKGLSAVPAVTFHTAHQRSAELWEETDENVVEALRAEAERVVAPARIIEWHVRRWPCSGPVTPFFHRCLVVAEAPGLLVLAGDGFGGSKVEGAFLSGLAAAENLADVVA